MSIKSFAHKGLQELFCTGKSAKVGAEYRKRLVIILDMLQGATCADDLRNARGFHGYSGKRRGTLAMDVSGNLRVTFRFENGDHGDVLDIDFEDPH
jgi:toxin HigB-1